MTTRITIRRRNVRAIRAIRELGSNPQIEAVSGILKDAPQPDGSDWTMATLAAHLHFGPVGAKQKKWPWMALAFDENVDHYRAMQRKAASDILNGRDTPRGTMMEMAVRMKGDQQRMMVKIREPELEESTKIRKAGGLKGKKRSSFIGGSGNPLIDTSALLNSHNWRVE